MPNHLTDSHNHLQDARFDGIRDKVIADMLAAGVQRCVVNGTSPEDWSKVAQLSYQYPELVIPSFGLHPWQSPTDGWLDQLVEYLDKTPLACVGECGLDRWIKDYDLDLQTEVFIAQLDLATERNLPLSIHCLRAWGHLLDILESHPLPQRGFLLHSYGGSAELVPRLVKLGAYFSFSGYFLFEKKHQVREAFKQVPADRLLIETDAPDMLPPEDIQTHPIDGTINHPANLGGIFDKASQGLNTYEAHQNFTRFFMV